MNLSRIAGAAQALAINAVSIYGVFGADWPVGTAIALYWVENVLRGVLILLLLLVSNVSRKLKHDETIEAVKNLTLKSFLLLTLAFNTAHAVFLAVILGVVLPRMSPAQRFQVASFRQGSVIIAILLAVELLVWVLSLKRLSVLHVEQTANAYVRRVVVVHLTIVCGMFGIVLFDRPTVLFASFAALKTVADIGVNFRAASSMPARA